MYDTVVIGKGPAGISGAIYLKRAGFNVLVAGKDGGSLEKADLIDNYYGLSEPLKGRDLFENGIKQAQRLLIPVISEEVTAIEYADFFNVKTPSQVFSAKTLLIATGKKRKAANIEGVEKFSGKGVAYCAVCDGFFYKNKNVGVIGGGKYALTEAAYLEKFAGSIKIFTNGEPFVYKGETKYEVIEDKILSVYGSVKAEGIKTSEKSYPLSGVFIAMGSAGAADFAVKLGIETENGNIKTGKDKSTNIPGIFAAGDCTGGFLQVSKSVADGAEAANSIIKYLRKK